MLVFMLCVGVHVCISGGLCLSVCVYVCFCVYVSLCVFVCVRENEFPGVRFFIEKKGPGNAGNVRNSD